MASGNTLQRVQNKLYRIGIIIQLRVEAHEGTTKGDNSRQVSENWDARADRYKRATQRTYTLDDGIVKAMGHFVNLNRPIRVADNSSSSTETTTWTYKMGNTGVGRIITRSRTARTTTSMQRPMLERLTWTSSGSSPAIYP